MNKKVAFIVTSHNTLGNTNKKTGIWAEELTKPYAVFKDSGFDIDIFSPLGGQVIFDPASINIEEIDPSIKVFLEHPIEATILTQFTNVQKYAAIFIPGGHGAMWDLAQNQHLADKLTQAFAKNIVIGAVCHGVAGLLLAKNTSNKPMVSGKKINSFTNEEEVAAGLESVVPFMLESKLIELGAEFHKAENWQAFSVIDGCLVTGQNPASSELVAKNIMALM